MHNNNKRLGSGAGDLVQDREKLKQERLRQYSKQIFIFEMDIVALEATGELVKAREYQTAIDNLRKAYAAVEAM